MRVSTFLLATLLAACGTSSAASAPAPSPQAPTRTPVAPAAPIAIDEEPPEEEAPMPVSDRALDEMDQSELEAACMSGSTAACDRLGH